MRFSPTGQLDRLSVAFSAICLAHCIALPSIALAVPLGGLAFADNWHFHGVMLAAIVPVSVIALAVGFRRHRRGGVIVSGAAGLALLLIAATGVHESGHVALEAVMTIIGSVLLAVAHIVNLRAHRDGPAPQPA